MFPDFLFFLADLSSLFTVESMLVVLSLILIEGLLSVDNALAIAAMASHLEEKQRKLAMNIGYAGAYGFRIVALFIASYIVNNQWLMILGSVYLIWLMCNHFAEQKEAGFDEGPNVHSTTHSFGKTIAMIAFLDLSLSFDNVVAAVGLAGANITLVYVGVTIGIITLRLVAGYCIKLLERHPWLEHTAFLLVGFVGILLSVELWWGMRVKIPVELLGVTIVSEREGHYHIEKVAKFAGILLILFGHIGYEKIPAFAALIRPFLRVLLLPAELFSGLVGGLFLVVSWPFRFVWNRVRS
jgi:YkoY family integral membrane protein